MEFKRILVAIDGSKVDADVVQLACSLAKPNKGKVWVTYVIQLERTLPLDAEIKTEVDKAEEALDMAEKVAEDCDYGVSTDLLQARAMGTALVSEATERDADLLLIGIGYQTRFGEFSLGEIVPHVLKNAQCRVMVLREPASLKVDV